MNIWVYKSLCACSMMNCKKLLSLYTYREIWTDPKEHCSLSNKEEFFSYLAINNEDLRHQTWKSNRNRNANLLLFWNRLKNKKLFIFMSSISQNSRRSIESATLMFTDKKKTNFIPAPLPPATKKRYLAINYRNYCIKNSI